MKVYIIGKITGNPDYLEQFAAVEKMLIREGFETVNPAEILKTLPKETTHEEYMEKSFELIKTCNAVYAQYSWLNSEGGKQEFDYASEHNYIVMMGGDHD